MGSEVMTGKPTVPKQEAGSHLSCSASLSAFEGGAFSIYYAALLLLGEQSVRVS